MEALTIQLFYFALLNLLMIGFGYRSIRYARIQQSWIILVFSIFTMHLIFLKDDPTIRMFALIATAFTAMKVIATIESCEGSTFNLSFFQWVVFVVGWAGMRAQPFENLGSTALPNAWSNIRVGVTSIVAGVLLICSAHRLKELHMEEEIRYVAVTAILLVAFSLILHFGWLRVSMGGWRLLGVRTYLLFKEPLRSVSIHEFWSKRWNLAFSEMTSIALFRPLKNKIGGDWASMLAFLFSGLLHEMALSLPVRNGYGLPLLYFVIQGAGVMAERELFRRKAKFLENRLLSRVWTSLWLLVPLPLLFHDHFVKGIIWPIAGIAYS